MIWQISDRLYFQKFPYSFLKIPDRFFFSKFFFISCSFFFPRLHAFNRVAKNFFAAPSCKNVL